MITILVVDDRSINRKFLAALLTHAGYRVIEGGGGEEALASAVRQQPDLIITDVMMPHMDGVELVNRLRADPSTARIPVIFYTATYRLHEARILARSCGAEWVLAKPSPVREILDAVVSVLSLESPAQAAGERQESAAGAAASRPARDMLEWQDRLHRALDGDIALPSQASDAEAGSVRQSPLAGVHGLSLRLAALLEVDLSLGAERDPQVLLDLFCRAAQDIVGSRYAGVLVAVESSHLPLRWSASGLTPQARADLAGVDLSINCFGEALRSREPLRLARLGDGSQATGLPASHPPLGSLLAAPMYTHSGVSGVLYFADKINGAAFDDEDEQFAATMAAQLGLFYGNLKLFEDLQRHAGELQTEIVERLRISDGLRESETRFRQLAENIRSVFFLLDTRSNQTLYVSPSYETIWGRSCASLYAHPGSWSEAIHPDDRERVLASDQPAARDSGFEHEYRILRPDGALRWVWVRGFPIRDAAGEIYRIAATAEDISERREQEQKIARLSRIRAVIGAISSAMLRIGDRDELLQEACRVAVTEGVFPMAWVSAFDQGKGGFEIIASHGGEPQSIDFLNLVLRPLMAVEDLPSTRVAALARALVVNDLAIEPNMASVRDRLLQRGFRSGAAFPLFVEKSVVAVLVLLAGERNFFDAEEIALLEWLTADLSYALEHIAATRRLDHLAYYDALTGLPNASLFRDRLDQFIHAAQTLQGKVCVVVVDLERFTQINDTFGRHLGDALLRQVGERFGQFLVEPYTLGRIGGDTYAAASPRNGEAIPVRLRDQMLAALAAPFFVDGRAVQLSAQVGIALFPADGGDGGSVFKNAEAALKLAKSSGQRYAYYSSELSAQIERRRALEEQLRAAVDGAQFVLHYQPRLDMISGAVVGAEALIRWQHPDFGLMGPSAFIPLAEQTGLIVPIGRWVIDTVCAQQAAWIKADLAAVPVAVNLSSVQFESGDLLQTIRDALSRHDLAARNLDLELTESAVMNDSVAATATLRSLRTLGVGLALDDFGTGYSSLAHLKRFPFDSVKIDRSFVSDITSNAEDAAIATAIIAMAHRLKLKVVAEGVETEGQFSYLRAQSCDEMQGNYFSGAVPVGEFADLLRGHRKLLLPEAQPADQRTVLLVDDESSIRSSLTRVLRRDGYRILSAGSGAEGLQLLAVNAVQVVISDQRMAQMSGTEFLNTVKELYPDTMRIILSGYTDLEAVTDAVNRGSVFKFLTKPWDDDLLREQVRDAFRRYRPVSRLARA